MKVFVIIFLSCSILIIEGLPTGRFSRSVSGTSDRQRGLFKEVMCLVKGLTLDECQEDESIDNLLDRLHSKIISAQDSSKPDFLSRVDDSRASLPSIGGLKPLPARRDAFYSDWRRK